MDLAALRDKLPPGAVATGTDVRTEHSSQWWALSWLRDPDLDPLPDAVVFPSTTDEVARVLAWADSERAAIITRGGGSGVVGGTTPIPRSVILDLSRMNRITDVDPISLTASVEAGVRGDVLEDRLRSEQLTLGHYPQSISLSTVGGWIAASATGHASAGYGPIEEHLLGLTAVLAGGRVMQLRPVPRSAAGPDLRRLMVGSEGTFGVVTEATLSLNRLPAGYRWVAFAPPSFAAGCTLTRLIIQDRIPALVVRTYDENDTRLTFGPLGHDGPCVLIVAFDEELPGIDSVVASLESLADDAGATSLPGELGAYWHEHHTDAIDLYRKIMGPERVFGDGVIVDTMEVAGLWHSVADLHTAIGSVLESHSEMWGCHLSHPYRSGASLYFTFMIHDADDESARSSYQACWDAAVAATHGVGATMTHHHGVGVLRASYMVEELGIAGLETLAAVKHALDPGGIMNPGKLIPER